MAAVRDFGILAATLLAAAEVASALPCDMVSTNDGNGLFTYTFQRGDTPYVWGLDTNASIHLQAYGVLEVRTPPAWTYAISNPDRIIFVPTQGTNFLDEPVTFSVRSCLTEPTRYESVSGPYTSGIILGVVFALPERTEMLGGGYQSFTYVGPALPRLMIERNGSEIVLRWPSSALGLAVEMSDFMPDSGWTRVLDEPVLSGATWIIKTPAQPSPQFFRLVTPCSP